MRQTAETACAYQDIYPKKYSSARSKHSSLIRLAGPLYTRVTESYEAVEGEDALVPQSRAGAVAHVDDDHDCPSTPS